MRSLAVQALIEVTVTGRSSSESAPSVNTISPDNKTSFEASSTGSLLRPSALCSFADLYKIHAANQGRRKRIIFGGLNGTNDNYIHCY